MASIVAAEAPAAVPTGGAVVNSQTSGDQINPRAFVDGDGRIYVVWEEVASGVSRIFFSMSEDGGATFHTRTRVDDIAQGTKCLAKTPVVVVNSTGNIFVAWSDNRTGTYQIYFSSSNDGDHFSSNAVVASTSTWVNQTLPDMDIENDNLFLTWSEQQLTANNNTYIRFTYSTNSGSSFRSPIRMDTVVDVIQLYPSLSV
ncbi:MAG: hypothetical protein MUE65_06640, partial [Methanomassiliicoccales archaeon]|nr:hypothetical protein [Methanomassiliicoccales archaeon]